MTRKFKFGRCPNLEYFQGILKNLRTAAVVGEVYDDSPWRRKRRGCSGSDSFNNYPRQKLLIFWTQRLIKSGKFIYVPLNVCRTMQFLQ